jgi:dolichol-phosphate mannosyltransferase
MPISPEDLTIVIPTLNEREAIGFVLDELRQEGYENVLVVDGYSTDGTPDVARERGATVVFQHGAGKAGAIKTALEHVKTPYMLVMDGDYSYDPKDIKRLLAHAANYDEVIGARDRRNMGWLHRLGNWLINHVFNLLFGTGLTDVCSGMYLVRTDALRDMELKSRGFNIEVEIAAHMCTYGKVTEVPISYRPRIGRKKLKSLRDGVAILANVLSLARDYNPMFLFSSLATIFVIPGALLTLWQLYLRYVYGTWSLGITWLGLVLLVVGLQGFTVATISLMLRRMERRILQFIKRRQEKEGRA